jgi:nicotinate phosphoribosyltransferase
VPWVGDGDASLLTDLYEITMAAAFHADGLDAPATFELSVRDLPEERNFLIAAGLDDALGYLEQFRFEPDAVAYLRSLGRFRDEFLDFLADLRFEGEVWAVPEGTIVFGQEPLIRITAPIVQAQLVETFLLNCIGFQTLIASKAARVALAAAGRPFADFGARRSHGADAGLKGARAAYIGGASATSVVLAGMEYGIPVTGTMAHSYVLGHASEREAFTAFARTFPDDAVLLVDTYDTIEGTRIAAQVAAEVAAENIEVRGIRLDSGDLAALAVAAREILDDAGLTEMRILASGGLDEHKVAALVAAGAPIDGFGVGTSLTTSDDAPSLDVVYKLVQDHTGPRMKTSSGKLTLPGVKQVHRMETDGLLAGDVVALADEEGAAGEPLLERVMRSGRRTVPPEGPVACRTRTMAGLRKLPEELLSLTASAQAPVQTSPGLDRLLATLLDRGR